MHLMQKVAVGEALHLRYAFGVLVRAQAASRQDSTSGTKGICDRVSDQVAPGTSLVRHVRCKSIEQRSLGGGMSSVY